MLSTALAALYEVEPKALMQAVKRNAKRFPHDFMFQLNAREFEHLRSRSVTAKSHLNKSLMKVRFAPYAFTQEGIAMLSRPAKHSSNPGEHRDRACLRPAAADALEP
jgi:hypothetical protein